MGSAAAAPAAAEEHPQAPAAPPCGSAELLGILAFCPWEQRAAVSALSASLRSTLGLAAPSGADGPGGGARDGGSGYWRFLCERLAEEHQVYVPQPVCGSGGVPLAPPPGVASSWRELFEDMHRIARAESAEAPGAGDAAGEMFSINVAVRFRPARPDCSAAEGEKVTLPLHQKVQLMRERLGCSSKEAVAMIMRERAQKLGGPGAPPAGSVAQGEFQPCFATTVPDSDQENRENRQPACHGEAVPGACAPHGKGTAGTDDDLADAKCSVLAVREDTSSVLAVTRSSGLREFGFDRVFAETAAQEDVYELSARRLVAEFLNGRSSGVICYGQTGSGKTYTMFGAPEAQGEAGRGSGVASAGGVVPRACMEALAAVRAWRERGLEARLGISYVEVFGSEISDLLATGQVVGQGVEGRFHAVRATDRVGHRYVLDGHNEVRVESWEEVEELLRSGEAWKRRAHTAMNERSTRAHTIMVLSLELEPDGRRASCGGRSTTRRSRLFFADLGGSEQLAKSQADAGIRAPVAMLGGVEQSRISWREYYQHRQRVQETLNINKGLFSLKRVVEALHRRSILVKEGAPAHTLPYVPYQDSKLTMLLQECLGGSAKACIVTTAAMDPGHAVETLQTLRFADTCSQVQKSRAVDQAASVRSALDQVTVEIEKLQADIVRKERWETRWETRQDVDTIAGRFGEGNTVERVERVLKTVLVGAEQERERLEQLLKRQAELQGIGGDSALGKDYREMQSAATADGGRGKDFRQGRGVSFASGSKVRAKDFETEQVLAETLRFLFGKAATAPEAFGETREALGARLAQDSLPEAYHELARALRASWEERAAAGSEPRSFGKAMLDQCQAWQRAFRADPGARDAALGELLAAAGAAGASGAAPSGGRGDNPS